MAEKVQKGSSPLGIASLCLGIAACCIGAIPYLGLIAIPLGLIGLLLAFLGFLISIIGRKSTIGFQIAGGIICVVGIVFAFQWTQAVNNAAIQTLDAIDKASNKEPEDNSTGVSLDGSSASKPESEMTYQERVELAIKRNKEKQQQEQNDNGTAANTSASTVAKSPTVENASTPSLSPTVKEETPEKQVPSEKWYDASKEAVLIGDIEVRITKVVIGKVETMGVMGSEYESDDDYLLVYLSVRNNNPHKKHDVRSWGHDLYYGTSSNNEAIVLVDNYENSYDRCYTQDTRKVKGGYVSTSLYPNKSIDDVAVFEVPVDGIEYLRLKLSVKWVDNKEEGFYRFQIPASMIQRQ